MAFAPLSEYINNDINTDDVWPPAGQADERQARLRAQNEYLTVH
jgi:hypothetical protein